MIMYKASFKKSKGTTANATIASIWILYWYPSGWNIKLNTLKHLEHKIQHIKALSVMLSLLVLHIFLSCILMQNKSSCTTQIQFRSFATGHYTQIPNQIVSNWLLKFVNHLPKKYLNLLEGYEQINKFRLLEILSFFLNTSLAVQVWHSAI